MEHPSSSSMSFPQTNVYITSSWISQLATLYGRVYWQSPESPDTAKFHRPSHEVLKPAGDWSIAMSAGSMSALDHAIGMFLIPGEAWRKTMTNDMECCRHGWNMMEPWIPWCPAFRIPSWWKSNLSHTQWQTAWCDLCNCVFKCTPFRLFCDLSLFRIELW